MSYTDEERRMVWLKATPYGSDPNWRLDVAGRLMHWHAYGNRASEVGWEIDHWWPSAFGGLPVYANLQPLHWQTNAEKSDHLPGGGPSAGGGLPRPGGGGGAGGGLIGYRP